ncbi:flavin reductase family protein [Clostridium butyricum]|uniref:flavin reductase family protein n=1 Tax=Clostridium butyricum TaxID=1492 RepID=UPI0013D36D0B|nr:flavin reductase family protein [Clostridium butyricum]MBZ0312621.1 flavin reductase family protein [Clostridium butyricum]MCQ2018949.1 flavin reductase family protein [Clostridium butyricum]MCQ2022802.1 flavin reductase family protein [Clostridium butyricum]NFB70249.1 flavin reductase family protein [Clostridium butyricum]NFB90502.1 flavin reductase family protein [Clostridium butyricum]
MKEIKHEDFQENAFEMIGKDWLLITAEKDGKVNTMTASWGGVGVLWNKKVAYIFIRPQRYTKEFVDFSDRLSVCVLPNSYRKELAYLGNVSGKDEDKISNANLKVQKYEDVPYFDEARLTLLCRKLYAQDLKEECFIEKDIIDKWYPEKDYHTMYVVEIEKILSK